MAQARLFAMLEVMSGGRWRRAPEVVVAGLEYEVDMGVEGECGI